jgi:hypothetical protein
MPTDAECREGLIERLAEARVIDVAHRALRNLRVEIKRYSQPGRLLEDRPEVGMVDVAIARPTAKHGTFAAQVGHTSPQLERGLVGSRRRQGGETLEAIGPAADGGRDEVVDLARGGDTLGGFEVVNTRACQRKHLHIDAAVVHIFDALFAQISEPRLQVDGAGNLELLSLLFRAKLRPSSENKGVITYCLHVKRAEGKALQRQPFPGEGYLSKLQTLLVS